MKGDQGKQLLGEMLVLFRKYGPEPFEELRDLAEKGFLAEQIRQIMDAIIAEGKLSKDYFKQQKTKGEAFLTYTLPPEAVCSPTLNRLRLAIEERVETLRTQDLLDYLSLLGIETQKKAPKHDLIKRLFRILGDRTDQEVQEILDRVESIRSKEGNTLEGWADVIMKERKGR